MATAPVTNISCFNGSNWGSATKPNFLVYYSDNEIYSLYKWYRVDQHERYPDGIVNDVRVFDGEFWRYHQM